MFEDRQGEGMMGRYVTRTELNSSLVRLEARVNETNKIIREQNSQFATLLEQEAEKREGWCEKHGEAHADINEKVNRRSVSFAWWVAGMLGMLLVSGGGIILTYLLARH
jgi:Ni,Fe-hydrogenase I large subunit